MLLLLGMLGLAVGNLAIKAHFHCYLGCGAAFRYTILGCSSWSLLSVFT